MICLIIFKLNVSKTTQDVKSSDLYSYRIGKWHPIFQFSKDVHCLASLEDWMLLEGNQS